MFDQFNYFIIMYSITDDGLNHVEHVVGFEEPPTLLDTQAAINDFVENELTRVNKPVYICQLPKDAAMQVFTGT